MPPRTPLGIIDGNRRPGGELTPYQRGKIEGACSAGSSFPDAASLVKCDPRTARSTLLLAPERLDGHIKPRTGRPKLYDVRFERRVLRLARWNAKMTYEDMKMQLDTYLSRDTLRRILQEHGLFSWLAKKRPYLTEAAVKKRIKWCLEHADWTFEEWATIIWSDECSVERGAGARRNWVWRTPGQKWDKEMVDTYKKGNDISVIV
jgi:hypothetical protein